MKKRIQTALCLSLILSSPAYAAGMNNSNLAQFTGNAEVTASTLGAVIASSNVNFHPDVSSSYAGNTVATSAFDHAFGVMAVNQNSGINAIAQQAVTVRANNVSLNATQ